MHSPSRGGPDYLTSNEAADKLGYRRPAYTNPRRAFAAWLRRMGADGPRRCYRGSRLLFDPVDLDRFVRVTRDAAETAHVQAGR